MPLHNRRFTPSPVLLGLAVGLLCLAIAGCRPDAPELDLSQSDRRSWIPPGPLPMFDGSSPDANPSQILTGQSYEATLGHEVRRALAQIPGQALANTVLAPAGGHLRLAAGAVGSAELDRLHLRVLLGERELWQGELSAGKSGWLEAEIEIPATREQTELRLESTCSRASTGVVFWGHPTLLAPAAVRPGPGLLLISIDTLRVDRLSLYGHDRATSPHIDAWAKTAAVFEQAVVAAPWTLPSHVSMLTGIDALRHGINHDVGQRRPELDSPGAPSPVLLAELLRRAGFATAAHTGGAYLHPRYGFQQGFDSYASWPDRGRSLQELSTGVDRALEFMSRQSDRPFFFFLHTYDVHDPYAAREPFFSRLFPELGKVEGRIALESPPNTPETGFRQVNRFVHRKGNTKIELGKKDRPLIDGFYDSNVAHADNEIGRLLTGLRDLGLDRRTLVILTSDHGEALLDGEAAGHVELFDHTLLVPLILAFPDRLGAGSRFEQQVRSVDIVPTVLDWLNLELPADLDGVSLVDLLAGGPAEIPAEAWSYSAAANRGLALRYQNQLKVIFDNNAWLPPIGNQPGSPRPSLEARHRVYDLGRDRRENAPLTTDQARAWAARVAEHFERSAVGLRLRLVNRGPGHLVGEIKGPMVRPVGTKSHDLACDCLRWIEMDNAAFDLPAGESFTLHFEKVFGRRLRLKGQLAVGSEAFSFDDTFDVRRLPEAAALAFDGSAWSRTSSPEGVDRGFIVGWNGGVREHRASPADEDPELRQQLEALGYL